MKKRTKRERASFIGRCCMCDRVLVGDPCGFRHIAPLPRNAGEITMQFGYGSRHDVCSFHGLICDDCADQFRARMIQQTREGMSRQRRMLIRKGVRFAMKRELLAALKTPFQPSKDTDHAR